MRTLLLDKVYKPISFISFRKMVKLIMSDKVDIISEWKNVPFYRDMNYPSIIRLKHYIRRTPLLVRFTYRGVFRRDHFKCQYTGKILHPAQLTVDHVIPKSRGGKSTWENCVTASLEVNAAKGDRTPAEANLKLLKKPIAPPDPLSLEYSIMQIAHEDWGIYFPGVTRNMEEDDEQIDFSAKKVV